MIKIINAQVFNEEGYFIPGEIEITNTRFSKVTYDRCITNDKQAPFFAYRPYEQYSEGSAFLDAGEEAEKNIDADAAGADATDVTAVTADASDAVVAEATAAADAADGCRIIDAGGCYVIPGLIDIHLHGCVGYNFYDADADGLIKMLQYLAANGVTAVCPSTVTLPEDMLTRACKNFAAIEKRICGKRKTAASKSEPLDQEALCAAPVGVYLEGPFISPGRAGAQNPAYVIAPDVDMFHRLVEASKGLVKFIAIAPEIEGASEFISAVADEAVVSIAHTNADYDTTVASFELGAKHATHLYNAMKPLTNRTPNAVGAVLDSPGITAELICDGLHLHPAIVRTAMRLLGLVRTVFISDSMMAAGLGDGVYDLGGLTVNVKKKEARLAEGGNIAGSVSNLTDCLRVAVKEMKIPLVDAVRCASVNPACVMGLADERGRIAEGLIADLVMLDQDLNLKQVFVRGNPIKS